MHRPIDLDGFAAAIDALRADLDAAAGPADVRHLRRIARWARAVTLAGYAAAWVCPNPVAVVALAFGTFVRWAVLAHHTLHRGYDRFPGVPRRFTSRAFARGWRRAVDWLDWLDPDAWRHEHDQLHHYHLNEDPGDPDLVEALVAWHGTVPRPVRWLLLAVYAVAWKPLFYAPNTLRLRLNATTRRRDPAAPEVGLGALCLVNPLHPYGRRVWLRCWLPYAAWRFGLAPALFLPLGGWAWLSVLLNTLAAEAVTNAWAFLMIVPNHAGADLCRFDGPARGRGEFYVRQIAGTANYRCGGDGTDLLHGWLNYQIEHHVWPDLTLRQYQLAQPRLRAVCERFGVPYVQESVARRFRKMVAIAMGDGAMRRAAQSGVNEATGSPRDPGAAA